MVNEFEEKIVTLAQKYPPPKFVEIIGDLIPKNQRKQLYLVISKNLSDNRLYQHAEKILETGLEISIIEVDKQSQLRYYGIIGIVEQLQNKIIQKVSIDIMRQALTEV